MDGRRAAQSQRPPGGHRAINIAAAGAVDGDVVVESAAAAADGDAAGADGQSADADADADDHADAAGDA